MSIQNITLIQKYLKEENYLGLLVYGPFLNEVIEIFNDTLLVPLESLYYNHYIDYIKDFLQKFDYKYSRTNIETFQKDYSDNKPVCFIIYKSKKTSDDISIFEKRCNHHIEKAKLFLSLTSGQSPIEFFKVLKLNSRFFYKTELVQYNKIYRLWINEENKLSFIDDTEKIIENQSFSLSLFNDANREANHIYKSARYFMVLESITGSNHQSRKHIKTFFESKNLSPSLNFGDNINEYRLTNIDAIEIAGIMRAKLFHGVNLKYKYFKSVISEEDYNYLSSNPEVLSRYMRDLCETAFNLKNGAIFPV